MRKLTVKRSEYYRKGGTYVNPAVFKIRDVGAPGRGRQIIPPLKKGTLNVHLKNPADIRRAKEIKLAKKIGEKRVVGKLQALAVLFKRTHPEFSRRAAADAHYIAGSFKNKKRVRYPTG